MNTKLLSVLIVVVSMTFPFAGSCYAADDLDQLLNYVPKDVNTIAVVRIEEILKSPRGKREDWAKKSATEFLGGAVMVPPSLKMVVRASHVHPGAPESSWSVGIMPLPKELSMADLARHENAVLQTVAGKPVVHSENRHTYFSELVPGVLGIMTPGFRQDLARWIRSAQNRSAPDFSDYLRDAASSSSGQIVMAIDMDEMLEPKLVHSRLKSSPALRGKPAEVEKLTKLIRHLKGIQFIVQVTEKTTAQLQFDFSVPVGPEAAYMKPVLIEFLEDAGAMLDDLQESTVELQKTSVVLRMTLSDSGLRRIMSLILSPPPTAILRGKEHPSIASRDAGLEASKRYYRAVNDILDDLQRSNRRAKNYARTAQWHENFAEKIDQLPVRDVEPKLRDYGFRVSTRLRALSASLQGMSVDVNVLQKSITYNRTLVPGNEYVYPWGWVGYRYWGSAGYRPLRWNVTSNLQQVREKQAEAIMKGSKERLQIWRMLEEDQRDIRRKMVDRFGEKFDPLKRRRGKIR